MHNLPDIRESLVDMHDSILVIIDVQEKFLRELESTEAERLKKNIRWITQVAVALNVPLVVTAEKAKGLDSLIPELAQVLPPDTPVQHKLAFDVAANAEILESIKKTGRRIAVLVGVETDVCVAQSALGLMKEGFAVVALADATASPGAGHGFGIDRMRGAGALITNIKALFFEWLPDAESPARFYRNYGETLGKPPWV